MLMLDSRMFSPAALSMVYESMNNPCTHNHNVNKITSIVLNIFLW